MLNIPVLVRGRAVWDRVQLPEEEFTAREADVRQLMENQSLDGLIIYADSLNNGPVTWLTNFQCFITWADALYIFPKDGKPILFVSQPTRDVPRIRSFVYDKIDIQAVGLSLVSNQTLVYKASEYLMDQGLQDKKWGGVNLKSMSSASYDGLLKSIKNIEDVSVPYDHLRVRKSVREISVIREAAQMAKRYAFEMLRACKIGVSEYQAAAAVDRAARVSGVEDITILLATGAENLLLHYPGDRCFQQGDVVQVWITLQYLHYWGVSSMNLVIGRPETSLAELYRETIGAADSFAKNVEAGKGTIEWPPGDILPKSARLSKYTGFSGIGLDLEEPPLADASGKSIAIPRGATVKLSFGLEREGVGELFVSSMYLKTQDGLENLSGPYPPELPMIL